MKSYRFMMVREPSGPWRGTRYEAQQDAAAAGAARFDAETRSLFMARGCWIDSRLSADGDGMTAIAA